MSLARVLDTAAPQFYRSGEESVLGIDICTDHVVIVASATGFFVSGGLVPFTSCSVCVARAALVPSFMTLDSECELRTKVYV